MYMRNSDLKPKTLARCMSCNTSILEELVTLRHQMANILGHPTHSSFVLEDRMAKTPEAVASFLAELRTKLATLVDKERQLMLQFKKEEVRIRC